MRIPVKKIIIRATGLLPIWVFQIFFRANLYFDGYLAYITLDTDLGAYAQLRLRRCISSSISVGTRCWTYKLDTGSWRVYCSLRNVNVNHACVDSKGIFCDSTVHQTSRDLTYVSSPVIRQTQWCSMCHYWSEARIKGLDFSESISESTDCWTARFWTVWAH